MAVSRVYRGGRTRIPAQIRRALGIEEGDELVWEIQDETLRVRVRRSPFKRLAGRYSDPRLTYDEVEEKADELIG